MRLLRRFLLRWNARARWRARKGRLCVLPSVHSPQLDNRRDLHVYVPAASARGDARHPVIYMHDGQNLFDPAMSFAGAWGVDKALTWASRRGVDAIVVGIPNMGAARIAEYNPFVEAGDRYLGFVTRTVKPLVDARFPTLPDRSHTGVAGSSMGGLISLYAFFKYPEVFGFAAALSPSLWLADGALLDLVARAPRVPGRLYLDIGMREGERDVALGRRLRDLLLAKGYEPRRDFRWVEDKDGEHHESAWGRRFRKALPFLLREPAA
jgi:predicted alpha/beta superfamily hydrolase